MKKVLVFFVVLYSLGFFLVPSAHALTVWYAQNWSGKVWVFGFYAKSNAPLTWDGVPVGMSNVVGMFNFNTTVLPPDCVGKLSDGVSTIDVVVGGCKVQLVGGTVQEVVARTGQTTCWDSSGTVIACAGTGQDGDIQAGVVLPSPRFTDNGDGTIADNLTKLIWLKNADCFGTQTWAQALTDANTLASGTCGLTDGSSAGDWRLPNVRELYSLIHLEFSNPALSNTAGTAQWTNDDAFNNVQLPASYYWSSTTYAYDPTSAWGVFFFGGHVDAIPKGFNFYVLPVRGGL